MRLLLYDTSDQTGLSIHPRYCTNIKRRGVGELHDRYGKGVDEIESDARITMLVRWCIGGRFRQSWSQSSHLGICFGASPTADDALLGRPIKSTSSIKRFERVLQPYAKGVVEQAKIKDEIVKARDIPRSAKATEQLKETLRKRINAAVRRQIPCVQAMLSFLDTLPITKDTEVYIESFQEELRGLGNGTRKRR